ncbi:MAG: lactate racemase domain-containing protein [Spirochaetaceae bacterium]|jgi:nickel-dependent lactate racemase|nr:lactate racemase domain-containing protein [Spirochaetaceae bacterium]
MTTDKTYLNTGGAALDISDDYADELFCEALENALADTGKVDSALLLPPDITRFHSRAGFFTGLAYRELSKRGIAVTVLPALGTHIALTAAELARMFPGTPASLFRTHDWRNDVVELGRIEKEWIETATGGAVAYDLPAQVNKLLRDGGFDLIISLGQVVPHEVVGMANHAKNIFVGTGGKEAIDKSHFAGACFGMEKMMGRTDTPVRAIFDEGMRRFGGRLPPILYALTVLSARAETDAAGSLALRGLYMGFGRECFTRASELARQVNVELLDEPAQKAVVYLEPEEFRTTWLGNKAIYRTRMAMADNGELLIIAPGLERFGEDKLIDALIRKYGYRPAKTIREQAAANADLAESLSAAAHLIHGSSEGRFTVRYCPGSAVSRKEIESAGYEWGDINKAMAEYDVRKLHTGWNTVHGERIFFVPNPAIGLWALRDSFR